MIRKLESHPGYVISSRGMWLPGIYDSERTARYAFRFSDQELAGVNARVCHVDSENRPITMDDLRAAKAAGGSPGSREDERGRSGGATGVA